MHEARRYGQAEDPEARAIFDRLACTRHGVRALDRRAKRPETRRRRVTQALEMLRQGKTLS